MHVVTLPNKTSRTQAVESYSQGKFYMDIGDQMARIVNGSSSCCDHACKIVTQTLDELYLTLDRIDEVQVAMTMSSISHVLESTGRQLKK